MLESRPMIAFVPRFLSFWTIATDQNFNGLNYWSQWRPAFRALKKKKNNSWRCTINLSPRMILSLWIENLDGGIIREQIKEWKKCLIYIVKYNKVTDGVRREPSGISNIFADYPFQYFYSIQTRCFLTARWSEIGEYTKKDYPWREGKKEVPSQLLLKCQMEQKEIACLFSLKKRRFFSPSSGKLYTNVYLSIYLSIFFFFFCPCRI